MSTREYGSHTHQCVHCRSFDFSPVVKIGVKTISVAAKEVPPAIAHYLFRHRDKIEFSLLIACP